MSSRGLLVVGAVIALPIFLVALPIALDNHKRTVRYRDRVRQLREQYPLENLDARLPARPRQKSPLTPTVAEQLRLFEQSIDAVIAERQGASIGGYSREDWLQKLHEGTVEEFVRKEGFGVMRLFGGMSESVLALGYEKEDGTWVGRNGTSVPQPNSQFSQSGMDSKAWVRSNEIAADRFLSLHFSNVLHFTHPTGFGAFRDRRQVVGFQPHQFNEVRNERPSNIKRIELVGMLLEEEPRVYVTATLPRMQDIGKVPTRSLDAFEIVALEKLRSGHDLFLRERDGEIRMVGAIRSAQQCLKCHGGERGDLLGAFSYGLHHEQRND
jgi:hypothetical protein